MSAEPIASQKKMPSDDVPRRMLVLSLGLIKSNEVADDDKLVIGGACQCIEFCLTGRTSFGPTALECGIFEFAVA